MKLRGSARETPKIGRNFEKCNFLHFLLTVHKNKFENMSDFNTSIAYLCAEAHNIKLQIFHETRKVFVGL